MITVFVKRIQNLPENEKQNIMGTLSGSALARLDKKKNEQLHLSSLCALSLLSNEQRADLCYTESGRPFFKNLNADISISHSRTYSAVAISEDKNESVGIDIEEAQSNKISIRFLTENEQISLENGTPYLMIWTKKEALFKFLKNDSTPFIHLDSTAPELHGAKFVTVAVLDGTVSMLTQSSMREYGTSLPCVKGGAEERGEGIVSQAFLTVCTSTNQLLKIIEK